MADPSSSVYSSFGNEEQKIVTHKTKFIRHKHNWRGLRNETQNFNVQSRKLNKIYLFKLLFSEAAPQIKN